MVTGGVSVDCFTAFLSRKLTVLLPSERQNPSLSALTSAVKSAQAARSIFIKDNEMAGFCSDLVVPRFVPSRADRELSEWKGDSIKTSLKLTSGER